MAGSTLFEAPWEPNTDGNIRDELPNLQLVEIKQRPNNNYYLTELGNV